ncbi:hypothetical protein [Pseudoteredinibacter isoporae]|uniref:hypothetical protein n=1 Tax=Pseudoteredinibacter isoporae TaxID=570281 RepID=UPI0031024743
MNNNVITGIAILLGLGSLANAVLMIAAPESWYWVVPGVPDRGPFNQHFVRDIGIIYLLIGASFTYGAVYPKNRCVLWLFPTAWLAGHGVFHIWEVIVGICGPESLLEDFAGVTLPALLASGICYASYTSDGRE